MVAGLSKLPAKATESESTLAEHMSKLMAVFAPPVVAAEDDKDALDKYQLADDLLTRIAGIDRAHFTDLIDTIREGRDGYVDGVEELINRRIATRLNFRRWWSQDSSFQLRVTIRESDIAFIVRDRTGTHYWLAADRAAEGPAPVGELGRKEPPAENRRGFQRGPSGGRGGT